jgi:hypothetical protein
VKPKWWRFDETMPPPNEQGMVADILVAPFPEALIGIVDHYNLILP